jgi:hypothetical protein
MRSVKQAVCLLAKGYDVHMISQKITQYTDIFKSLGTYFDGNQLAEMIALHKDADIFHCHNEPSWFVTACKEAFPDKPVIMDIHDSLLLRRNQKEVEETRDNRIFRHTSDERNNFQLADGLVYVCDPMKEIVGEEYALDQPNIVLPSFVPERWNRIDFRQYLGGLVYQGRVDTPDELPREWNFFQYSNYIPFAEKCKEFGMDFHIYTPRKNIPVREQYDKVCHLHEPQKYDKLIKRIGCHDWGLVGNLDFHEEWKHALPNKMFEYWAGCTPVVSINAEHSSKWLEETGLGITVESVEELGERWREHRDIRKKIVKERSQWTMDRHIHKLEELYGELV